LDPPIPLIPIVVEALVEENFLSFIVSSKTNQLLANPDNFFMVIFLKKLGAEIDHGAANSTPNHHSISGEEQVHSLDLTPNYLACTSVDQKVHIVVREKEPYTLHNIYESP
jgi:ABC-type Fe3+-citrate transport system substrate-binding protein